MHLELTNHGSCDLNREGGKDEMAKKQTSLSEVLPALVEPGVQSLFGRPENVAVFDSTCRDGGQTRRVTWTAEDKINLIREAARAGLRHIEVGWPVPGDEVNPKVFEYLRGQKEFRGVRFYAFMSTVKRRRPTEEITAETPMVKCVLETKVPDVVVFGKSWIRHVRRVVHISLIENRRIIEQTVKVLVDRGRRVVYDAEHAVDGWRDDRKYFFQTLEAAIAGGASRIVLCDTRGGTLTPEWLKFLLDVVPWLKERGVAWGVHIHDDSGVAVANTLLAVEFGCDHVQGTIGGVGERAGNVNLATVVPDLKLKMGIDVVTSEELKRWTALTQHIFGLAGIEIPFNLPFVGPNAAHHDGGTHSHAWMADSVSIEHVRPELVGNQTTLGLSNQAGRALLFRRLVRILPHLKKNDPRIGELLARVHGLEKDGWLFEAADGSFELLARSQLTRGFKPLFTVVKCSLTERVPPFTGLPGEVLDRELQAAMLGEPMATVEVKLADGRTVGLKTAKGDGPVNALDKALKMALAERGGKSREAIFPQLNQLELVNYHVQALIDHDGTAAKVRVVLFWRTKENGDEIWGTVAVSTSVTEASARALAAGYQYFLYQWQKQHPAEAIA